ncbi:MAG TPA: twin-arginine translocase TatA/TatE family subunit [Steroidobacteraceae bacterium]|jgi:sec-independent protein translocase protein TatA
MGIGFRELLVILVIALVVFGAKRLKTIGSDLGGAVKGFKKAMSEGEDEENKQLSAPGEKDADFESTPTSKTGNKSSNV